jgi:hypothetical protein
MPPSFLEKRIRRMISQLFRHGIGRLTALALVFGVLAIAQAQVATHTQLTATRSDHGLVFAARISDIAGNPAADGIVSLENAQGASLGSTFVTNGAATLTLDQHPAGSIYAVYSGSENFRASRAQAQVSGDATSTLPDFTITASPTSLSLNPGQYGTISLTITPLNGFNNMVTLSCSGNPPASACVFSPTTLTPVTANSIASSLQITTQAASGASLAWPGRSTHTVYAIVLPGLLAFAGLGVTRKRSGLNALRVLSIAALLLASTLGLSSCAARYDYLHHPPEPNPGIAAGNSTVTVSASSNNGASVTTHTLTIALTVN